MAELEHGIVRLCMAEGVANVATLPTHMMAKLRHGILRQGLAEGIAN